MSFSLFSALHEVGTRYRETVDILTHIINTLEERPKKDRPAKMTSTSNFHSLQRQIILSDIGFIDTII